MSDDPGTAILRLLLRAFGNQNQVRTGCGLGLGVVTSTMFSVLNDVYPDQALIIAIAHVSVLKHCICTLTLVMIPVAFGRGALPDHVKTNIYTLERLIAASHLPKAQVSMFWHSLISKYLASAKTDLSSPQSKDLLAIGREELESVRKSTRG